MDIQNINLTGDERKWISELIEYYKKNEIPNESQILLKCHFSNDFNFERIDSNLFQNKELTIYGIYCFDPDNEFLTNTDKILRFIRDDLKANKIIPRTYTSKELSGNESLGIHDEGIIQVCFKLISHANRYFDGGFPLSNDCFGYSSATVEGRLSHYLDNCKKYANIDSILSAFVDPSGTIALEINDGAQKHSKRNEILNTISIDKVDIQGDDISKEYRRFKLKYVYARLKDTKMKEKNFSKTILKRINSGAVYGVNVKRIKLTETKYDKKYCAVKKTFSLKPF